MLISRFSAHYRLSSNAESRQSTRMSLARVACTRNACNPSQPFLSRSTCLVPQNHVQRGETNSVLGRRSASDQRYGRTLHQACSPDLNVAFDSLMT
jgi:hypothetical protein